MPALILDRPSPDTDYADYYGAYLACVPPGDLLAIAAAQATELDQLIRPLPVSHGTWRPAPAKWSLREVLGHLIDTERVFSYRALHFARGDANPLPSFEQDDWVPPSGYHARATGEILDEWLAVRAATLAMMRGLPASALPRRGTAGGREFTVLALLGMLPGHVENHRRTIVARYLPK